MKKSGPSFIGIGASFSGLGVITKCLAAHPQVSDTIPAYNFFSSDAFTKKGLLWYEAHSATIDPAILSGDCSPIYLVTKGVAEKIVKSYPDTKIFVVVRNPIDRALAEYEHAKANRRVSSQISCVRYLTTVPTAQTNSFYGQHLHEYFAYYSSLQLHVIVYEELVENPLKVMQALYGFLDIDTAFIPKLMARYAPPADEPKHPSKLYRLRKLISRLVKKMMDKPPVAIFPPTLPQSAYLEASQLTALAAAYAVDARHLSNLLHRDMEVFWNLAPGVEK